MTDLSGDIKHCYICNKCVCVHSCTACYLQQQQYHYRRGCQALTGPRPCRLVSMLSWGQCCSFWRFIGIVELGNVEVNHSNSKWYTMIVMMMMMIALKDAIRNSVQSPVSSMYSQMAWVQSCANHVQHIGCSSHATCCVIHDMKGQLSYWDWQKLTRIHFSFILLADIINRWRRGGIQSTCRKPLMTSFRKCHILKLKNSSTN